MNPIETSDSTKELAQAIRSLEKRQQTEASPIGALSSAGLAGVGVWLVRAAIVDPEPTSKLALLVGGGLLCILGGGFSLIKSLDGDAPSEVSVNPQGLDIRW